MCNLAEYLEPDADLNQFTTDACASFMLQGASFSIKVHHQVMMSRLAYHNMFLELKADFYMGSVNFSCHDASLAPARYRSERIHIMAAEIST